MAVTITTQPVSKVVNKNRTTTLNVVATSNLPAAVLKYEWYEDAAIDVLIQSGTSSTFTPLPLTLSKSYYVKISDTAAAPFVYNTTSVSVTITVIDPPVITTEPIATSANTGSAVTLSVTLAPSPNGSAVSYQWYLGASGITDNPIVGAVTPVYTITNAQQSITAWVRIENAAGYVNSNSARVTVIEPFVEDSIEIREQKSKVFADSLGNYGGSLLADFPFESINVLSQAQSLADCAKNLPNRLKDLAVEMATKKLEGLLQDTTGLTYDDLQRLKYAYDKVQQVVEQIQNLNIKKPTLIEAIAALRDLTGIDLIEKTNQLLDDFAAVSGISDIVNAALTSDFCKITNYGLDGKPVRSTTNIPMGIPPSTVQGVTTPIGISEYSTKSKEEYDAFTFQLKEHIEADEGKLASYSGTDKEKYVSSISYLHTIALAYHDKISKTVDDTKDVQYRSEFEASITDTVTKNSSWSTPIINEFKDRAVVISDIINRNAQIIRNFYNPGGTGEWLPWYMSAYGHVKADDGSSFDTTTEADIASGSIKSDWQYLGNRGNKLVKGTSVASNYWKFGTVLEIRYADSKAPVGSGQVRVDDTGGMSKNVIDYFCAGDKGLFNSITSKSKNQGGATQPSDVTPIEVRVVSGGPKNA